ncbi:hypothetical protein [Salibacter sp.]|uniref:HvfA family oxazolone/thioamide-modified RiPP metallophore n=1 Tax=Salibacter sp. TaxID=2010995 RepID=UPI00287063DA|nr:hypothetical protein [Salibacter sp.]MDR9486838.1 hypothetical protein [Salibacter sp.]
MKKQQVLKSAALAVGTVAVGSFNANAANLFETSDLGSGAELRNELLAKNHSSVNTLLNNSEVELKCGEGKCGGESKKADAKDSKSSEHKCGEKSKKASAKEGKSSEHKCGEGKCGGDKKDAKKSDESKSSEHKCGEGKCGGH